jgi:threonine dehydrogenase-like Zn-dependent dehydrogenase
VLARYEGPAELDNALGTGGAHAAGQRDGDPDDFRLAIELLSSGRARAQPLITHRMSLAAPETAFRARLDAERAVKVLVVRD